MKYLLLATLVAFSSLAQADADLQANQPDPAAQAPERPGEQSAPGDIPTTEREFVDKISGADKTKVLEQFGEPSKMDDVKTNKGRVVASIWHYHYLNTDEKGAYYQTTELDFVDDKVVMVVFLNNDGSDGPTPDAEQKPSGGNEGSI